jgi:hypothetical protein
MLVADYSREAMLSGLEEVLVSSPDDVCLHRAFAGALLTSRDPARAALGRFIEAQLRLEGPCGDERRGLEGRVRKLQRDHARAWLGELAPHLLDRPGVRYSLARGWLDEVAVPALDAGLFAALARAPQARLLRRLAIEDVSGDRGALAALLGAPWLGGLRELAAGEMIERDRPEALIRRLLQGE